MKKLLTIFIFLMLANLISSQVYKTVNLQTAGTLTTLLTAKEKTTVTNLTITGKIDARDFKFLLFEVPLLTALDLSGAVIQAYNGTEGSSMDGLSINSINTMPPFSFYDGGITAIRNMKSIIFPNSLVSIGDCAFYWSGLINVTIPNSVTTIGEMAFNACFSLSTFTIGSSVTSIGGGAFHMCSNLKTIKSLNSIPPVLGNNCFDGVSLTAIYVPKGSLETYKSAVGWSAYSSIIFEDITSDVNKFKVGNNKISIFPIPIKNEFKIDFEGGSTFEILNLMGQVIYTGNINKSQIVQTTDFSAGTYLIKFKIGKSFEYKKIIKE
jgi:hypothetical protein